MNEEKPSERPTENLPAQDHFTDLPGVPEGKPLRTPFAAEWIEVLGAVIIYVAAYGYILLWEDWKWLPVAALPLIAVTELLFWEKKRSWESFVWLGCFLCACIGGMLPDDGLRVWDGAQLALFIHVFFVWWVLARSGKLVDGKSGHLLPLDAVNGFFVIPFANFFLRIRTVVYGLCHLVPKTGDAKKKPWGWIAAAAVLCLALFIGAAELLMQADAGFSRMFERVADWFRFDWDGTVLVRLLFSLPVGAWLFGLIGGARRTDGGFLARQRENTLNSLEKLRKVPGGFWTAVIAVFSALYLVFFAVQFRYLFGAFTRTLPEGFIVSEYARQGFFELCKVMAVNFAVLWLVTRMASGETAGKRSLRVSCLVLLAESMIFAVIALSKLALYISCFGFTPLRLQSSWLVCVLFAGCGLWAYTLVTGRPVFRKWMIFGAVTLALLCLV